MPQELKDFLNACDKKTADAIWLYLDGNPDAVHELIAVVAPIAEASSSQIH